MARPSDPAASPPDGLLFAQVDWAGRAVQIEYQWVGRAEQGHPVMVFLHEGLGSLSMWRDFPAQLCAALGCRGLVYSRPGYGRSTPRGDAEHWAPDFMHRQALELLPAFLEAVGVQEPVWLFGHSDGGSIALIHAARRPEHTAGAMVLAPHILVEEVSVRSIELARRAYLDTDLKDKLARHHADPDSAFWGWNRIWLDPAFRDWSLESEIASIRCPLLAVQGLDDEYGTLAQIRGIQRRVPHTELLELADCGHSPHRDQPARLISRAHAFFKQYMPLKEETS
jgi:pimeloyl-ACP methyl ester carboxylesterase